MISLDSFLQVIGVVIGAFSFCGVIFQYAVIRPIESKLSELSGINKSVSDAIHLQAERIHALELKITKVEVQISEIERRIKTNQQS